MKIEPLAPPSTFADFCDQHGIEPVARERSKIDYGESQRWYVSAPYLEIMDDGILISTHGNGHTPEDALADYAAELAGKRLVMYAMREERREFWAPNEWLES